MRQVVERWSTGIDRVWSWTSGVDTVRLDSERLEAGLDALNENAVRFTTPADLITVDARVEGQDLLISVANTGAGIPEADLERVLRVFETGSTAGALGGPGSDSPWSPPSSRPVAAP